ncbi:MAG TPA: efflux RND transporter periplasmic adaptor subunit [Planctomycetota bacterium]|nr:efflux RND transporter periplasmic adaptor subunit [Planctomycetota bacterium]
MPAHEGLAALKIDRTRQKSRFQVLPWFACIVAIGLGFASPELVKRFQAVEVSLVPAAKVSSTDAPGTGGTAPELSAAGYVIADRQSTLAAKVTGRLVKMNVSEAQHVKQGTVIAEVDHRELDATIEQVRAEKAEVSAEIERLKRALEQAEKEMKWQEAPLAIIDAEMREIQVTLADAQRRYERDKKVAERDAIPTTTVDDRLTEIRAAEAKLRTAEQRKIEAQRRTVVMESQIAVARSAIMVAQAREHSVHSRLKVLETQLLDYFVVAPFDGVVTEKMAEVGEIVAPISIGGNMARGSIITLADWTSLQAEVDVAETQIQNVKVGGRAAITVDAFPQKVWPGKVRRSLPRADRSKATVKVRVDFLERGDAVLPDMGVRVRFLPENAPAGAESGLVKERLMIPKAALQGSSDAPYVWIAEENRARKRSVKTGESENESIEIVSGINAGDKIVVKNADKIQDDNQRIKTE